MARLQVPGGKALDVPNDLEVKITAMFTASTPEASERGRREVLEHIQNLVAALTEFADGLTQ